MLVGSGDVVRLAPGWHFYPVTDVAHDAQRIWAHFRFEDGSCGRYGRAFDFPVVVGDRIGYEIDEQGAILRITHGERLIYQRGAPPIFRPREGAQHGDDQPSDFAG